MSAAEKIEETEADTATTPEPEGAKPPPRCMRLHDYFSNNDLGTRCSGFEGHSGGTPDPDRSLVNSGKVGFRQRTETELLERLEKTLENEGDGSREKAMRTERHSKAQRFAATHGIARWLSPDHWHILRRAYGPQDVEPMLKEMHRPGMNEKDVEEKDDFKVTSAWNKKRDALDARSVPLRMLIPLTSAARDAFAAWRAQQGEVADKGAEERRVRRMQAAGAAAETYNVDAKAAAAALRAAKVEERDALVDGTEAHRLGLYTHEQRARALAASNAVSRAREAVEALKRRRESLLSGDPGTKRAPDTTLTQWIAERLTEGANKRTLDAAKIEAYRMLGEAWAAWKALLAQHEPRMHPARETFERAAEVQPWDL